MLESIFWKCLHSILGSYSSSNESTSDMSFVNYEASFPCLLNNDYFFALYFLRDEKTVGSLGCPELKHVTEQRPVPQTHGNWQSFPPVYVQCWHSVQKAGLQLVYSLRLLPYRDLPQRLAFFPLSPAINNKGVFGTPEHPHVSVLSSLSQSGFQNQAMLGTVENVPEIL